MANKEIIGEYAAHRGTSKMKNHLEDILKAIRKLNEKKALPLFLGTGDMIKNSPVFNVDIRNSNIGDVLNRVKVLEESMGSFMKDQNDQVKKISEMVGSIGQGSSQERGRSLNSQVQRFVHENKSNSNRFESPGKRKKMADESSDEILSDSEIEMEVGAIEKASFKEVLSRNSKKQQRKAEQPEEKTEKRDVKKPKGAWKKGLTFVHINPSATNEAPVIVEPQHNEADAAFAPDVDLVLFGVSKDASEEQLKSYVEGKGLDVIKCELITTWTEARTHSFKLTIKAKDLRKAQTGHFGRIVLE